jgi:hypothetical protein
MKTAGLIAVLVAMLLLPAGVASADDTSVYGAYVSRDADFAKAAKQVRAGTRAWRRSHLKRPGKVLAALRRAGRLTRSLSATVKAEQASTDHGRAGKAAALASLRYLRLEFVAAAGSVRAATAHKPKRAKRLAAQADRLSKRALAAERRARREFKAAGVQLTPSA